MVSGTSVVPTGFGGPALSAAFASAISAQNRGVRLTVQGVSVLKVRVYCLRFRV